MSIKRRLEKLEDDAGVGRDEVLCIFRTTYEGKEPGTINSQTALIVWATGIPTDLKSEKGETPEEFEARVEAISKLSADNGKEPSED